MEFAASCCILRHPSPFLCAFYALLSVYLKHNAREPGGEQGDSYVADCGSIAMGVVATSILATHAKDKLRNSVKAWAKLVMENYVSKDGGIWGYTAEWWGWTATAGAPLGRPLIYFCAIGKIEAGLSGQDKRFPKV